MQKELLFDNAAVEHPWLDLTISGNAFQGTAAQRTIDGMTFTTTNHRDDSYIHWTGSYNKGTLTGIYYSLRGNFTVNNFFYNSGGWSDGRIVRKGATMTGNCRISLNQSHPSLDEVPWSAG